MFRDFLPYDHRGYLKPDSTTWRMDKEGDPRFRRIIHFLTWDFEVVSALKKEGFRYKITLPRYGYNNRSALHFERDGEKYVVYKIYSEGEMY